MIVTTRGLTTIAHSEAANGLIVALGTGIPTPITRSRKSSVWSVDLGNGDIWSYSSNAGMERFNIKASTHESRSASHNHPDLEELPHD